MIRYRRILCILGIVSFLFAHPVSSNRIQTLAESFFPNKTVSRCEKITDNLFLTVYDGGGFVLSSADDGFPAILAFSDRALVNEANPSFLQFCRDYSAQINALKSDTRPVYTDWNTAIAGALSKGSVTEEVPPLISSKWNQAPDYNRAFPTFVIPGNEDQKAYVGCVAVVMGQLMNYYEHPVRGFGRRSYYSNSTDSLLSAVFDTSYYDYGNMPDSLHNDIGFLIAPADQVKDVSTLLYQCAVSVDMELLPDGSSAAYEDMMYALCSYFDYGTEMVHYDKGDFASESDWHLMLKQELDGGHPVPYRGQGDGGGHAFLIDGYKVTSNTYYHINWGWGGYYNGWFLLSALNPEEGYDYTDQQGAVFNISPNPDNITRYAYSGFEGYQAAWIYSGEHFYSLAGETDIVYGLDTYGQWLISPKIRIPNNDNTTLSIQAVKINSGTKTCKIMLSQTDTLRSSFNIELTTMTPGTTWNTYEYTLRNYKNKDVYIGIKYESTSGYIVLDDFTVYTPKVSVGTDNSIPQGCDMLRTYPNPFNPITAIEFQLASTGHIELSIYDLSGRHMTTLINGIYDKGAYKTIWDASELSSGIYIASLTIDNDRQLTQKMVLVK